MPKGRQGCLVCGEPSSVTVQVWLRDYTDETYANGCRKQRSIGSITRRFCRSCGESAVATATAALDRRVSSERGCGLCGCPTDSRIQIWIREGAGKGKSRPSVTGSYCEECSLEVYDAASAPLDPDSWKPTYQEVPTTGLEAARRASIQSERRLI